MKLCCILSTDDYDGAIDNKGCPFDDRRVEISTCPWKDDNNRCRYKANRHDLMVSLSRLSTRIFKLSKQDSLPANTITEACLLLQKTQNLIVKSTDTIETH